MTKLLLSIFIAASLLITLQAQKHYKEIEEIKSGSRHEARLEWWGFNSEDSTEIIQAALKSGIRKLTISKQIGPWITAKTLNLPDDIELIFEEGAEIKAKQGHFKRITACLLQAKRKKNITLRGPGILTMNKTDYQTPEQYKQSGHRHTLGFYTCNNIKIEGLTIQKSGGDGIYINKTNNIIIKDSILDQHTRQGISVISGENILIKNCLIKNTKGAAPQAGIDFEPNEKDEKLLNCKVEKCRFENNALCGINVNLTQLDSKQSPPADISIENCQFEGGQYGISFMQMQKKGTTSTAKGHITFRNCQITSPKTRAIQLDSIRKSGPSILFDNITISQGTRTATPIYFLMRKFLNEDSGNVTFKNCTINSAAKNNVLDCLNFGSGSLQDVTGTVTFNGSSINLTEFIKEHEFNRPHPKLKPMTVDQTTLQPAGFKAVDADTPCRIMLRGAVNILLYAQQQQRIEFSLKYTKMGRYPTPALPLVLITPDGKTQQLGKLNYQRNKAQSFTFTPTQTGGYKLIIPKHINCISMTQCNIPWSIYSRPKTTLYNLFVPNGDIYFAIPPSVTAFTLEVSGNGGRETIDAALSCEGTPLAEEKNISRSKFLHAQLEPSTKTRLAKLTLSNPKGGVFIMLPAPLLPLFSNTPENVFINTK
jgi:hypothetical protein